VLLVAPVAELAEQSRDAHLEQALEAQLATVARELIPVYHAKAAELAELLLASLADDGILATGSLSVDERTNTLVVAQPARPPRRTAAAGGAAGCAGAPGDDRSAHRRGQRRLRKGLGVRWGGPCTGRTAGWAASCSSTSGWSGAVGAGRGLLRSDILLDLELSAMEKSGNGEIISQPKVVTADKETARILKGTEVPYQETTKSGATSVSFREASLSLEVTPQITPDNQVIMEVKVTKDEPDYVNALNNVPPIRKNEVNAKVLVAMARPS
jgi:type IV pilus assembly protein PilQ